MDEADKTLFTDEATKTSQVLKPWPKVTNDSFADQARTWIARNGGRGFMIAPKELTTMRGDFIRGTPMEWGAWLQWRRRKKLSTHFMRNKRYYMVPTQWPYQFDGQADKFQCEEDGRRFFDATISTGAK